MATGAAAPNNAGGDSVPRVSWLADRDATPPAGLLPIDDGRERIRVRFMDEFNRITALVCSTGSAHGRAAVGWRQGLVVATLAALATSAVVFLAC